MLCLPVSLKWETNQTIEINNPTMSRMILWKIFRITKKLNHLHTVLSNLIWFVTCVLSNEELRGGGMVERRPSQTHTTSKNAPNLKKSTIDADATKEINKGQSNRKRSGINKWKIFQTMSFP